MNKHGLHCTINIWYVAFRNITFYFLVCVFSTLTILFKVKYSLLDINFLVLHIC